MTRESEPRCWHHDPELGLRLLRGSQGPPPPLMDVLMELAAEGLGPGVVTQLRVGSLCLVIERTETATLCVEAQRHLHPLALRAALRNARRALLGESSNPPQASLRRAITPGPMERPPAKEQPEVPPEVQPDLRAPENALPPMRWTLVRETDTTSAITDNQPLDGAHGGVGVTWSRACGELSTHFDEAASFLGQRVVEGWWKSTYRALGEPSPIERGADGVWAAREPHRPVMPSEWSLLGRAWGEWRRRCAKVVPELGDRLPIRLPRWENASQSVEPS